MPPAPRTTPHTTWTNRTLLAWMTDSFAGRELEAPRLCAELLLAHVLGCERLALYTDADRPASPEERATLRGLVRRALEHEPIQYLVGAWPFFGIELKVDRRALIPRPCTEQIAERVIQASRAQHEGDSAGAPIRIADLCTGGGCIAVAIARHLPASSIVATDLSAETLSLARENAHAAGVEEQIEFRAGDGLGPLVGERFDWLLANPPYISDHEWAHVPENVRSHEPELALRGGVDGMDVIRPMLEQAAQALEPGGRLMVEVAASHAEQAAEIARTAGLRNVEVERDFEDLPRFVRATRE